MAKTEWRNEEVMNIMKLGGNNALLLIMHYVSRIAKELYQHIYRILKPSKTNHTHTRTQANHVFLSSNHGTSLKQSKY